MLMVWPFSGLATLVIQYIKAEDRVFYYFSLCVTILKATGGHKPPSSLIFSLHTHIAVESIRDWNTNKKDSLLCISLFLKKYQRNCLPSKVTFGKIIGKVLLPKW